MTAERAAADRDLAVTQSRMRFDFHRRARKPCRSIALDVLSTAVCVESPGSARSRGCRWPKLCAVYFCACGLAAALTLRRQGGAAAIIVGTRVLLDDVRITESLIHHEAVRSCCRVPSCDQSCHTRAGGSRGASRGPAPP